MSSIIYWLLLMNKRGTWTPWIVHRDTTWGEIPTTWLIAEFLLATNADDTSTTANNWVATGVTYGPWWATFDTDTDSIIAPSNVVYDITTWIMSFKIRTTSTIIWYVAARNNNINDDFLLSIADPADGTNPWEVTFYWWSSTAFIPTAPAINDWSWHTVVITYAPLDVNVYIDGTLRGTYADNFNSWATGAPLNIGYREFDTPWHTIGGDIAKLRRYNVVLDSAWISALSNEANPT